MELVRLFLSGDSEQRELIIDGWPFELSWDFPNPSRLACRTGEVWPCVERIEALLAYYSIASKSESDTRQFLIALAMAHHSCLLISMEPGTVFSAVAEKSVPKVAQEISDFIERSEADKSLDAFMLTIVRNSDGEAELHTAGYGAYV